MAANDNYKERNQFPTQSFKFIFQYVNVIFSHQVARMQAELAAAQDAVSGAEKSKSNFERQLRDMQGRLEEAEAAGGKNLKNQIRKLEQRVSCYFYYIQASLAENWKHGKSFLNIERKLNFHLKSVNIEFSSSLAMRKSLNIRLIPK